ncbi:MAG: bifunctional 5,10-methylenetetrahydrofolate dehydrogenase/5,10-methenyltetrahydrofolate cyclohydrolase [Deltaproteobacteria bacterium]|nr:bifunctional 5,10-methylenetetrahydrofolate dehydrogenase/5,10-methenyltetrahydrofolate cyclohydrolase [Deltaproteobacteria bacterium]
MTPPPPSAHLISGVELARRARAAVAERVARLKARGVTPRLDVLLVGDHAPSQLYVRHKARAAEEVGVRAEVHRLPAALSAQELRAAVRALNARPETHGVLIQLPLPPHIPAAEAWSIVEEVSPHKDVDGLHPLNQGLIGLSDAGFVACTPLGCLRLIREVMPDLRGVRAAVVGRSRIVGRPLAQLLSAADATVTLCHSRTADLALHTRDAELVVAAAGAPRLLTADMVRPGAVVIDVGIHRIEGAGPGGEALLCGDVDEGVRRVARAVTPVPGGVGPMTIASLMENVCLAAERAAR